MIFWDTEIQKRTEKHIENALMLTRDIEKKISMVINTLKCESFLNVTMAHYELVLNDVEKCLSKLRTEIDRFKELQARYGKDE